MKKLILMVLIVLVSYWALVFAMPSLAASIDKAIGMPGLSDSIRGTKSNFDTAITDIPSLWEFQSGALDIKNKVTDGINTTKDTIDTVRGWAQKVEDTYNQAKDTFEDAKTVLEDATQKVEQIKWVVDSVSNLTGSGS